MKTSKIIASVLFATATVSAIPAFAQNDPYPGNIYYGEPGEPGYRGSYPVNLGPVANQAPAHTYGNSGAVNSPTPFALDGTMAISDFLVEPDGNVLHFTVSGHPNGQVKVKFGTHSVTLTENRSGIYTGAYILGAQDNFVGKSFNAQMSLKEGKKTHIYNMYQTFGDVRVASVPAQQGYQPPYTWTSRYAEADNYRPNYPQYRNYGYNNDYNPNGYRQYNQKVNPYNNPYNVGQVVDIRVQQVPVQHTSIVGSLIGGGAGGVLGSTIGRGNGRLWATGVGAATGAMVGNQVGGQGYQNQWYVMVQFQNGQTSTYMYNSQPPVQIGSVVQRAGNGILPVQYGDN